MRAGEGADGVVVRVVAGRFVPSDMGLVFHAGLGSSTCMCRVPLIWFGDDPSPRPCARLPPAGTASSRADEPAFGVIVLVV